MPAKFFCENCNAEVPRNASRCPKCGRAFASVRCPSCNFTGSETLFKDGCPICGYCAPAGGSFQWPSAQKPLTLAEKLPAWVYALAALALGAVIFALVLALR
jgi:hypothetical protein